MTKILQFFFLFSIPSCLCFAQNQFWGTASVGGEYGNGFIFKTDSIGDNLEIVHHFQSAVDGENIGALLYASNNKLYGLAASGGQLATDIFKGGTFFEYDLATDQFRVLQHFGPTNTALPNVYLPKGEGNPGLTEVAPGVLYGLMAQGEYVFSYNVNTGAFTQPFVIPTYQGAGGSTLKNKLNQAFYKVGGYLYATTQTNSSCPAANPNMGSVIRVTLSDNTVAVRYRSSCLVSEGYMYNGFLVEANGKFYGTTGYGGAENKGVLFEYDPASNAYTKKYSFTGSVYQYEPTSLVRANNGKLYGTAHGGGIPEPDLGLDGGAGVLFEYDLSTNLLTKKHNFTMTGQSIYDMGPFPGSLINSTNGKLYGTTHYGVFEYNPGTEAIRVAGRFNGVAQNSSIVQLCRKPAYQLPASNTYVICKDDAFTLDLASANTTTASWKHNNVTDASKTTPVLNFNAFNAADAGTWVCTLTNECGSTVAQTVTLVQGNPDKPAITAQGALAFCEGGSVTLSAPPDFAGYHWSTGETTQTIVATESNGYTVSVNNGCESDPSEATQVTVYTLPAAPTAIETPAEKELKAVGTSDVYEWTLNDVVLPGETTAGLEVTESGIYKVRSVSPEGCRSADFASIQVTITGVEEDLNNRIEIYPNPTRGTLYIKAVNDLPGLTSVWMIDATGQSVLTRTIELGKEASTINVEHLAAGLYEMIVRHGEYMVLKKVMIR